MLRYNLCLAHVTQSMVTSKDSQAWDLCSSQASSSCRMSLTVIRKHPSWPPILSVAMQTATDLQRGGGELENITMVTSFLSIIFLRTKPIPKAILSRAVALWGKGYAFATPSCITPKWSLLHLQFTSLCCESECLFTILLGKRFLISFSLTSHAASGP